MRASQIRRHISAIKPSASGITCIVCASNELPRHAVQRRPAVYIVNTQPNYQPGAHWVLIYLPSRNSPEKSRAPYFFDPLGYPPSEYRQRFIPFLRRNNIPSQYYYFNHVKIQRDNSTACGLYCLFFLKNILQKDTYTNTDGIIEFMLTVGEQQLKSSLLRK